MSLCLTLFRLVEMWVLSPVDPVRWGPVSGAADPCRRSEATGGSFATLCLFVSTLSLTDL